MTIRIDELEQYKPAGEPGKSHQRRLSSGLIREYLSGDVVLDIGAGCGPAVTPWAKIIDLNTDGYNGFNLPYIDNSVDSIFSSHCLEHVFSPISTLREWFRVIKTNGYLFLTVPHQYLYEKKDSLPSKWNEDHKRFYTPATLLVDIEKALLPNHYRIIELRDVADGYNYNISTNEHSQGCYEIEIILQKIVPPNWPDFTYSHLLHSLEKDNIHSVVICGAGDIGHQVARVLIRNGFVVDLFTDKKSTVSYIDIDNHCIPVCHLEKIVSNNKMNFVIASRVYVEEIKNELQMVLLNSDSNKIYTIA